MGFGRAQASRSLSRWVVGAVAAVSASSCGGSNPASGVGASATTGAASDGTDDPASTADGATSSTGEAPDGFGPGPWDAGIPLPPEPQVPGDAEAGYRALLENGYVSCGMPYSMFELGRGLLGSYADGEPLPGRTGKNAEVPYNWTVHARPDGVELASPNCLECHAGRWNGELLVGLGKADADYTRDLSGTLTTVAGLDLTTPGSDDLVRWAERLQAVAPYTLAPNVGVNPADTLAVVLAAHRDRRTLAWSDEPALPLPDAMIPVDTPPWWWARKKGAHFFNGMGRGDHRGTLMFASMLCTETVEEMRAILGYFNDIRAYVQSVEPPTYPFEIDVALAASGEPLFEASCAGCHGLYGSDPDADWYPSLLLPLEVVGTDPVMAGSVTEYAEFIRWFNESPFGEVTTLVADDPFIGYVAPPLDGIWATAPFLHNGSVPTLELVLDSSRRPKYWRRVDYDSTHFDEARIGWPFVELDLDDTGGADGLPASDRKHVYDTTRFGYGNGGHPFGDHFTEDERRAVLEYLKTL
jgi:mono/diheme cytochrome c family protein